MLIMIKSQIFILLYLVFSQAEVLIIESTPEDSRIVQNVLKSTNNVNSQVLKSHSEVFNYPIDEIQLIIDLTSDESFHISLEPLIRLNSIPIIIVGEGRSNDLVFYTFPDYFCKLSIVSQIIPYFSIAKFGAIWEYSEVNSNIIQVFSSLYKKKVYQVNIKSDETQGNIKKILAKTLKTEGITAFLFFHKLIDCNILEETLKDLYLEKPWNIAIYFDCAYQLNREGSFAVVYNSVAQAGSWSEYLQMSINTYLGVTNLQGLSKFELQKLFTPKIPTCKCTLINKQSGKSVIVGSLNPESTQIHTNLTYFTGTNHRQILYKPLITLSANTGTINPPGYLPTYQNSNYQKGTYFGISEVNSNELLLTHYNLTIFDKIECGVNVFEYNYTKECFSKISSNLGIAYVPSFYSITIKVLNLFDQIGIFTPVVSGMGTSTVLSNSTLFPRFKRIVSPLNYLTVMYARLIQIMGWKNIVVFYTDESYGSSIYSILVDAQEQYKYTIVNSEEFRKIDYFYTAANFTKYKPYIQNAVETNCNLFFLAMSDPAPFTWVEALYDYGLRRGDITIFLFTLSSPSVFLSKGSSIKRSELLHGSFTIYNAAWVGDYGKSIAAKYFESAVQEPMPSFYIDTILTIAHTSDFLLNQGSCFEDPEIFMEGIKSVRFNGTSGAITFDIDSNDRSFFFFNVYNYYEDNGWKNDAVATISPLSTVYYSINKQFVWSNGKFPTDLKAKYKDCEFIEDVVRFSNVSSTVQISVCVLVFIVIAVIALYDVGKLHDNEFKMITKKQMPQFEDFLMFWFIFIESVQLIAIGPSVEKFNKSVSKLSYLFSLKFTIDSYFRNNNYWIIFYLFVVLTSIWVILFILSSIALVNKYLKFFKISAEFFSPLMANYLFIPIMSALFSILSCEDAIGEKLADSFFYFDCSVFCWKKFHVLSTFLSMGLVMFYVPIAIYYKARWQQIKEDLIIKANSFYLLIKNILLIVLIIFDRLVKSRDQMTHSVLFTLTLALMSFTVVKGQAFNYDRANLWVRIMTVCVLWNSIVCVLFQVLNEDSYLFLIMQLVGWSLILIIGFWLNSRLPDDLLDQEPRFSITALFKFVFHNQPLQATNFPSEAYSVEIDSNR